MGSRGAPNSGPAVGFPPRCARRRPLSPGVRRHGNILGETTARWDNAHMKIAIELNATQSEQLEAFAASLGVPAEQLAQAAVADLIDASAADFDDAASR